MFLQFFSFFLFQKARLEILLTFIQARGHIAITMEHWFYLMQKRMTLDHTYARQVTVLVRVSARLSRYKFWVSFFFLYIYILLRRYIFFIYISGIQDFNSGVFKTDLCLFKRLNCQPSLTPFGQAYQYSEHLVFPRFLSSEARKFCIV